MEGSVIERGWGYKISEIGGMDHIKLKLVVNFLKIAVQRLPTIRNYFFT